MNDKHWMDPKLESSWANTGWSSAPGLSRENKLSDQANGLHHAAIWASMHGVMIPRQLYHLFCSSFDWESHGGRNYILLLKGDINNSEVKYN